MSSGSPSLLHFLLSVPDTYWTGPGRPAPRGCDDDDLGSCPSRNVGPTLFTVTTVTELGPNPLSSGTYQSVQVRRRLLVLHAQAGSRAGGETESGPGTYVGDGRPRTCQEVRWKETSPWGDSRLLEGHDATQRVGNR